MGNWTRANSEDCLFAVRGKPQRVNKGVRQMIHSPVREHSRKPDEARERLVTLMGDLPRVELFARNVTEGWDVWGNEAPASIAIPSEPQRFGEWAGTGIMSNDIGPLP